MLNSNAMSNAIQLPAVFGRYVLIRRLNRGGMGEIFVGKVGEIEGFEKPIVIKKILPALSIDKEFVERFINEAKIAINLSHANIVPVYEVGKVKDQYFLAMQYVEGRDLRTLITHAQEKGIRIPYEICLYIVREMANGLAYAHRQKDGDGKNLNLVHCDISPPNVLVSFEGEVKVIDFGIAKSASQRVRTDAGLGFGKFGYMAPEQLLRGAKVDRRTDIYACGVVLYELLTGSRLFNFTPNSDYRQVARYVTAGRFSRPIERDPKLPKALDLLVMRALKTAKEERFQTAEELRDAVQQELYKINPTISADRLSSFLSELFPQALDHDRQVLKELIVDDIHSLAGTISENKNDTVSFAQGVEYSTTISLRRVREERADDTSTVSKAQSTVPLINDNLIVVTKPKRKDVKTRELDHEEQAEALAMDTSASFDLQRATNKKEGIIRSNSVSWITFGFVFLLSTVLAFFLIRISSMPRKQNIRNHKNSVELFEVDGALPSRPDLRVERKSDLAGSLIKNTSSGHNLLKDPPKKNRRSLLRSTSPNLARRKKARVVDPLIKKGNTVNSVKRKLSAVKREYFSFERSYGKRLKSDWQKILFSATYLKGDPQSLKKLDRLLDQLRLKMAQIKR